MIRLITEEWNVCLTKQELINLEESVITMLDFDLQYIGPIPFLERFQRIYNLDLVKNE